MDINPAPATITRLLQHEDGPMLDELMQLAYGQIRKIAKGLVYKEKCSDSLQTCGLVHEAFLRFRQLHNYQWYNRNQFYSVWTCIMRRVLIDRARERKAGKRGGDALTITFNEDQLGRENTKVDILALDESINRLAQIDASLSKVVNLRYFGGLALEETAEVMGCSVATVKRKWTAARAWLYRELSSGEH